MSANTLGSISGTAAELDKEGCAGAGAGVDETADHQLLAFRFVVAIGRGMHRYGAPVHRLERALEEISRALGVTASFLATPTSLMTTIEIDDDQKTHLSRQSSGEVDLGKLSQLDDLAQRAIAGEIGIDAATREVLRIETEPPRYPAVLQAVAFALSSGGFACFLGARWIEIAAATVAGLAIGALSQLFGEGKRGSELFEPSAAFLLALVVPFLSLWLDLSIPLVVLAGMIVLVPGLTFTQAVTELAQSSLVSGTSRLFGALLVFLLLAFGAVMGRTVSSAILGESPVVAVGEPLPFLVLVAAVVVTSVSFLVMFKAEWRDFAPILGCGMATFLAARGSLFLLSESQAAPLFAAFFGATVAGLTSNAFARSFRRPALVPRVPAMMHLVPGSLGYRAVTLFSANDPLGGLNLISTVAFVAVSIATGLFLANAVVPPRQRL